MKDPQLTLWLFAYKNGPAPARDAMVWGKDEGEAYRVACAWCLKQGYRLPAAVRPAVVAGPSILGEPLPAEPKPEPLPDPVAATTGTMGSMKEAISRAFR